MKRLKSLWSSSTREVVGEVSEMSRSDLEKFYNETFQNFNIKACTFLGRRCTGDFEDVSTLNGRCRRFCPKEQMMETARYSSFARQATISMIISFNESDWTSGWNHLLVGATMYLLPSYENTLGRLQNGRATLKRIKIRMTLLRWIQTKYRLLLFVKEFQRNSDDRTMNVENRRRPDSGIEFQHGWWIHRPPYSRWKLKKAILITIRKSNVCSSVW